MRPEQITDEMILDVMKACRKIPKSANAIEQLKQLYAAIASSIRPPLNVSISFCDDAYCAISKCTDDELEIDVRWPGNNWARPVSTPHKAVVPKGQRLKITHTADGMSTITHSEEFKANLVEDERKAEAAQQ